MSLFPPSVEYALVDVPRGKDSQIYVVDAVHGSDNNSGLKWQQPLLSIEAAYAKTVALHNDVILLVGNGTSYATTAALLWANDFTHLIGLNSGGPEPRSRIKCPAALATTPFVTWSADGCVVKNISFWHTTSNALGLVNVLVSGSRNTFDGVQFAGGGGANAITGARHLQVGGTDEGSGNTFKNCIIGLDTIGSVNGMAGVEFILGAMHTTFDDCLFLTSTNGTTYAHVTVAAAAGVGRFNLFRRCLFVNEGNGAQAECMVIAAALPAASRIFAIDCWMYGCPEWNLTNNGLVTNITIAANTTGVATGNLMMITS